MPNDRRYRLSTRSLTVIVGAGILTSMVMLAMLAAVFVLGTEPALISALSESSESPGPPSPASSDPSSPALAVADPTDDSNEWQTSVLSTPSPLRAKQMAARDTADRPRWTATPLPTDTPIPSPTPNPTFVSSAYGLGDYMPDGIAPDERWIDVNVSEQKLVAYEGFMPVFESLVSTGTARYPTVTGQFRIWLRFQSQDMDGYRLGYDYYLRDVPYVQYFYQDYALHGTFWHSNFGTPMSHGCVNLSPADAEWLFNWAGYGTLVNVHP